MKRKNPSNFIYKGQPKHLQLQKFSQKKNLQLQKLTSINLTIPFMGTSHFVVNASKVTSNKISIFGLHKFLVDLEPMTLPSTLLLQGKEIPFELELIGSSNTILEPPPDQDSHSHKLINQNDHPVSFTFVIYDLYYPFKLREREREREKYCTYITLDMKVIYNNPCSPHGLGQLSMQQNAHISCVPVKTQSHDFLST